MLLIFHIIVATSSIFYTAFVFISPSKQRLNVAYVLVGLMLVSGVGLMFRFPGALKQTCLEGLAYLAFVSFGIIAARQKLAAQKSQI